MGDECKAFVSVGGAFAAHDTVRYKAREYARSPVHINSAEGFNDRVRRTVPGVFHHISPHLADLYFNEIGFAVAASGTGLARRRCAGTSDHEDPVGENTACLAALIRVPLRHWTRDAPNEGRRERPHLKGSCL